MTKEQYFLTKLAEEASEVAQMAMKCAQFGRDERYQADGPSNYERLIHEINDFRVIVGLLRGRESVTLIDLESYPYNLKAKEAEILKYLKYSQDLGQTQTEETS